MKKIKITSTYKPDFSNEYHCIHSIQNLNSDFDTSVFTSNIPIFQLLKNRDIILVDDLRGDARWGMNKIIQRNISSKRVEEIKKEYLEDQNRTIKFFPAITVVLLPKTDGEPKQHFTNTENGFDQILGIDVEKLYDAEEYVMDHPVSIKWDKNIISALVIDGQHRISAIRSFYDGKNESHYKNVSIPVSFVVFNNNQKIDLIQATRALFIDVNNTPRLVSEEKLIFIDDRNIQRRITSRALGANDPGDNVEDVYQRMLREDDFLIGNDEFINRYFIEESGKDDEEQRGFLLNHKSLFPWEISNIMTIHRNILGNILLKYRDVDKTRDIRSISYQLNSSILEEIEKTEAIEELSDKNTDTIRKRLKQSGLSENEIGVFNNLIALKKINLEEVKQAQGNFLAGTTADSEEEKDREYFINLLHNVYNQDCSKDSAFELRGTDISELLDERCSVYNNLLVKIYNGLWFTKEIKESILKHPKDQIKLIFNFLVATHESLKVETNIRLRTDKIERQISIFFKEDPNSSSSRLAVIKNWAKELDRVQSPYLLRKIVGQEMLFMFIVKQNVKFSSIDIEETLKLINSLGKVGFFNSNETIKLNFFGDDNFVINEFNPWSGVIMKGESMKPGISNATKGANLISFVTNNFFNRENASTQLSDLNNLQKSYGKEVLEKIANQDLSIMHKMYLKAHKFDKQNLYLTAGEIDTIKEVFKDKNSVTQKATSVMSKLFGGLALEQIVTYYNSQMSK